MIAWMHGCMKKITNNKHQITNKSQITSTKYKVNIKLQILNSKT
jgi:hypothetical protein